jgi:diacylglycerol kinase (ATP)
MKNNGMARRIGFSLAGLCTLIRRERSFRTHVLLSTLLLTATAIIQPPSIWWAVLLHGILAGLAMEAFNGALEALADLVEPHMNPVVGAVKDMASAAALLVNLALVVAFGLMMKACA